MAIDLEPIANFDASSATPDQHYLVQDDDGVLFVDNYDDGVWLAPSNAARVAFALINPYVAPEASVDEPAGEAEAA